MLKRFVHKVLAVTGQRTKFFSVLGISALMVAVFATTLGITRNAREQSGEAATLVRVCGQYVSTTSTAYFQYSRTKDCNYITGSASSARSQTGPGTSEYKTVIQGRVVNQTGEGVPGVSVAFAGHTESIPFVITAKDGSYTSPGITVNGSANTKITVIATIPLTQERQSVEVPIPATAVNSVNAPNIVMQVYQTVPAAVSCPTGEIAAAQISSGGGAYLYQAKFVGNLGGIIPQQSSWFESKGTKLDYSNEVGNLSFSLKSGDSTQVNLLLYHPSYNTPSHRCGFATTVKAPLFEVSCPEAKISVVVDAPIDIYTDFNSYTATITHDGKDGQYLKGSTSWAAGGSVVLAEPRDGLSVRYSLAKGKQGSLTFTGKYQTSSGQLSSACTHSVNVKNVEQKYTQMEIAGYQGFNSNVVWPDNYASAGCIRANDNYLLLYGNFESLDEYANQRIRVTGGRAVYVGAHQINIEIVPGQPIYLTLEHSGGHTLYRDFEVRSTNSCYE